MTSTERTQQQRAPARFIIADDHELTRAGLRTMLADEPELELVGEASTGLEALELCRRVQPDLALLDIRMPEMDGLAAARAIKQEYPAISIVMVTMNESLDYLQEAIRAGAAGYVLKDAPRREFIKAVRHVLRGDSFLNGPLTVRLLQRLATASRPASSLPERITPRELEVLQLLTQGLTNRQIAAKLLVSVGTVKVHVERIIAKLGVADRTQAAVHALELGLVQASLA